MSEWIKLYAAVFTHPKTRRLAKRLDVSPAAAVGHLASLWAFTAEFAPDGNLSRFDQEEVELGAGWDGTDGRFIKAAIASGYLDKNGSDSLSIHDWSDYGGKLVERKAAERKRSADRRAAAQQPTDDRSTTDGRPPVEQCTTAPSRAPARMSARAGQREEREERDLTPPTPPDCPQPVDNCPEQEQGEEQAPSEEQEQGSLEALRHNPHCEERDCDVRALRVQIRSQVAEIVGPEKAGQLYNPASPINKTLAGMAGYICASCWKASAAPGVTMADRQPVCAKALREYVQLLVAFNRERHIKSLPGYLRTRYGNLTEAPVADELLGELRTIERKACEAARGEDDGKDLVARVTKRQPREPSNTMVREASL